MNTKAKLTPEIEANKWKKGEPSPNPTGRPRKATISEAYARQVDNPLPDDIRSRLKLPRGSTWADAMACGQLRSAVKGNTVAAKEIADRIEGRVRLGVEVGTPEGQMVCINIVRLGGRKEQTSRDEVGKVTAKRQET